MKPAISLTVTAARLRKLADCAERIPGYADLNGSLLISVLRSDDGTPVRLILDRKCIPKRENARSMTTINTEAIPCFENQK